MIVMFSNAEEFPHRVLENFEVYLGREAEWHNLCLLYYLDRASQAVVICHSGKTN